MSEIISLVPQLDKKSAPCTLLDALHRRRTCREFSPRPLGSRHLSQIFWTAYGFNRPDGHRTVPAALGVYPLRFYAFTPEAVYLYDAENSQLIPVADGDHRAVAGMQDFVRTAPLNILIFSDYEGFRTGDPQLDSLIPGNEPKMSALDAGAAAENIYLYCAAEDIAVVERMMVDEAAVKTLLSLPPSSHFQVAMTLGYPI